MVRVDHLVLFRVLRKFALQWGHLALSAVRAMYVLHGNRQVWLRRPQPLRVETNIKWHMCDPSLKTRQL